MIRHGARLRSQRQAERERRQHAQQGQINQMQQQWKEFSFPLQAELHVHLTRFGLDAAEHVTSLLLRLLQEQQRPSPASLLSASLPSRTSWSREQLTQRYEWSDFPLAVQDLLFAHSITFTHREQEEAECDVQRATNILRLVLADPLAELGAALAAHQTAFVVASMADVATIAARLSLLLEPTEHQQE